MDGVIIHSNPFHKIALQQFCTKYGYDLSEDELARRIYGRTNKEWITNLFGRPLPPHELAAYAEEKESLFRRLYERDITEVAGLTSFLEKTRGLGIPCAIGTSAPLTNVDFVLAKTGIRHFFSAILHEADVEHGKPNPEIYLKTAASLGKEPGQCVVFEDSISGVKAGLAAGSPVVGVLTTHSAGELSGTKLAINDFQGLEPAELVRKIWPSIKN
jgi:beta-phosphoglucomutase